MVTAMLCDEWKEGNDARLGGVGLSCLAGLEELVERG